MSNTHTGNVEPSLSLEEHARIGGLDGRKVFVFDNAGNQVTSFGGTASGNTTVVQGAGAAASIAFPWVTHQVSGATIYAVVNTAAVGQSSVVLDSSLANIGFATVNQVNQPALVAGAAFIGLTTVNIGSSNTVVLGASAALAGIVTIANSNVRSLTGNVTLSDAKTYIGLVTATIGSSPSIQAFGQYMPTMPSIASGGLGPIALDLNGRQIVSLFTVADPKGYIGLVSIAPIPAGTNNIGDIDVLSIAAGANYIGLASVNIGGSLPAGTNNIGDVDVLSIAAGANYVGLASVNIGGILPSLSAGAAFIGLATVNIGSSNTVVLGAGAALAGIVTIANSNVRSLTGNITLSDAKTYIGLVTATLGASTAGVGFATISQAFPGGATIFSQVISLTSTTTIAVAPASNLFFIKNLHVSSLGRSEVEIRSGATTLIPFTSLSTTSGFNPYFGEYGLPSRAQADALVVNLAVGSSTIAVMANLRFGV